MVSVIFKQKAKHSVCFSFSYDDMLFFLSYNSRLNTLWFWPVGLTKFEDITLGPGKL